MKTSVALFVALAALPSAAYAACPHGYFPTETYRGPGGTVILDQSGDPWVVKLALKGSAPLSCDFEPVDDTKTASIGQVTCGSYSYEPVVFHLKGDASISAEFAGATYKRVCR